jgi:hypothetical protein
MKWNRRIRQTHRSVSIVFTLCVLLNLAINLTPLGSDDLSLWVGLLTLIPLGLLLLTGLYLFVLPWTRSRDHAEGSEA